MALQSRESALRRAMRGASNMGKNMHAASSAIAGSGATGAALRAGGGAARGLGRFAMTIPGGALMVGLPMAAASHDSTKNSFGAHMSREMLKNTTDMGFEMALFGLAGVAGAPGAVIAGVASAAMFATGTNPGEMMGHFLDKSEQAYKKEMGMGATPITKNKQTMRSQQQSLNLLMQSRTNVASGVGGAANMLGHEAQFMHN